jgi:hypothetical protein
MKSMTPLRPLCLLLGCLSTLQAVEISNLEGSVINVDILQTEPDRIQIRMVNGHVLWLERERLTMETRQMLTTKELAEQEAFKELNDLLGIPLFADNTLRDDATGAVAERLAWPKESETNRQSSYRHYPPADYRILGCRPFSAVLYGNEGTAQRLSIVFANKGDFRFSDPPTKDEIEAMEEAIEADAERIEALLTDALGEPDRQQFGSGRGIRQLIQRWDWKGQAFLLASQDGEYVNLKIMTTEAADNKGRGEKLSDAALRELSIENIMTRGNGDVLIGNIPMVDQGPKGYCVPATFERYLRYMQIPADMYLLAMAGQTQVGGGTSLSRIIESIDSYISSQNRSMKEIKTELDLRIVQKHIDRGLPMIWTMYSSPEYNQFVNERSVRRSKTTNWEAWAEATQSEARDIQLRKDLMAAHACMIIGYNKATGEIAVSDSWGPGYRERWVPADQAEQVSQGSIYLIDF